MKKMWIITVSVLMVGILVSCGYTNREPEQQADTVTEILKIGDAFTITGRVDYSDEPSDIGQNYCSVTGEEKLEYVYIDIYDEESKWSSNVFYTKGNDTALLKEYVGQTVVVSGEFDAECHGVPYITNIEVLP